MALKGNDIKALDEGYLDWVDLPLGTQTFDREDDILRRVFIGNCPECGSKNTKDCMETLIDDPNTGICLDCYTVWILEDSL